MEFDRQQLIENINTLIQQKNMRVGDIESAIGISTGYISRLSKEGSTSIPATDVVWKLARYLGVSTDALISGDYSQGRDNLSVLNRFIAKLIVQTEDGTIDWTPVTTKYVNAVLKGEEPSFFLVQEKEINHGVPHMEDEFSEATQTYAWYQNKKIVSQAAPLDYAWMTGDGFKATLKNGRVLYLFRMCASIDTGTLAGDVEEPYYEMYMQDWVEEKGFVGAAAKLSGTNAGHWHSQQVFDTLKGRDLLEEKTKELYNLASQSAYDLKINSGVKTAILDFLNDGMEDESERQAGTRQEEI